MNVIYQCYLQTKPKDKKYIASSDFSIKYIIIIIKYLNCHNYTCTDLFNQYNCNSTNFKIKLLDLHLKMFHDEKQGNWMFFAKTIRGKIKNEKTFRYQIMSRFKTKLNWYVKIKDRYWSNEQ